LADSDQEKSEEATPERQKKAREEGQFPRGKDSGNTLGTLLVLLLIVGMAEQLQVTVRDFSVTCLRDLDVLVRGELSILLQHTAIALTVLVVPVAFAAAIGATAAGVAEAGFHPNMDLAAPKWERLNPISRLQQMFSPGQALATIALQLARVIAVAVVAYFSIKRSFPALVRISRSSVAAAAVEVAVAVLQLAVWSSAALVVLVAIDYGYSWFKHNKQIMMTREEIKEEFKQQEGDPKIRARQRARAREIAKRSVAQAMKGADFVIANPTHVSVAIRYRPDEGAPVVAAKGYDEIALHIRHLAKEHNVPIIENVPLARALAKRVKVGRHIPVDLYGAVAEILAFVYRLKKRRITA
jgi:flagellar biosynthesis protein FlhB